jgi:hypothetical protein
MNKHCIGYVNAYAQAKLLNVLISAVGLIHYSDNEVIDCWSFFTRKLFL